MGVLPPRASDTPSPRKRALQESTFACPIDGAVLERKLERRRRKDQFSVISKH